MRFYSIALVLIIKQVINSWRFLGGRGGFTSLTSRNKIVIMETNQINVKFRELNN